MPLVDPEHGDLRVVTDSDFTDFTLTWKASELVLFLLKRFF